MQGPKTPTFRPMLSLWPAASTDSPVIPRPSLERKGDIVTWSLPGSPPSGLPADFAVREVLAVDPCDDDAVMNLMRRSGLLVGDDPSRGLPPSEGLPVYGLALPSRRVSLADCVGRLRILRALAKVVVAKSDGDSEALLSAFPSEGFRDPRDRHDGRENQEWQVWYWWTDYVNAALGVFQMFVDFDDGVSVLQRDSPNAYEAAVLQLAELATRNVVVGLCANERCGQRFTQQRTARRRYPNSEHASGVKYCSRQCAKAQSERDRRARRKAEGKS